MSLEKPSGLKVYGLRRCEEGSKSRLDSHSARGVSNLVQCVVPSMSQEQSSTVMAYRRLLT